MSPTYSCPRASAERRRRPSAPLWVQPAGKSSASFLSRALCFQSWVRHLVSFLPPGVLKSSFDCLLREPRAWKALVSTLTSCSLPWLLHSPPESRLDWFQRRAYRIPTSSLLSMKAVGAPARAPKVASCETSWLPVNLFLHFLSWSALPSCSGTSRTSPACKLDSFP